MEEKVSKEYLAGMVKHYRDNGEPETAKKFIRNYLDKSDFNIIELEDEIKRLKIVNKPLKPAKKDEKKVNKEEIIIEGDD